jgi:hypothetical protein
LSCEIFARSEISAQFFWKAAQRRLTLTSTPRTIASVAAFVKSGTLGRNAIATAGAIRRRKGGVRSLASFARSALFDCFRRSSPVLSP